MTNCGLDVGPGGSSAWYLTKAFHDLGHEIVTENPELIVNIDGQPLAPRIMGVPYFFWDCDSFFHGPPTETFDKLFIGGSPDDIGKYPLDSIYLPHAFDPEIHKRHDVEQEYDLVMIGNAFTGMYEERNRLVSLLQTKYKVLHIETPFGDEYAKAMSRGKLIFNRSLTDKNIPMRFFEGMAIGALVHNDTGNLDSLATKFEHYIPYIFDEELLTQVDYYLSHDDERIELAKRATKHALANHTYQNRAETILGYL